MRQQRHKENEALPPTAVWRNGGFSASYDSFVVGSSAVLRLNFCATKPARTPSCKPLAVTLAKQSTK